MLCPNELVTLITATAISLAEGKTVEELGLLSSVFAQLGDTLATIVIQREFIEDCCKKINSNTKNQEDSILRGTIL